MANRLQGKIALCTASAAGIGKACAQAFAAEGARVIATDIDAKGLAALGTSVAETHVLDVRDTAAVNAFAQKIGAVDTLLQGATVRLRLPTGNDAGSGTEPGQGLWGAMSTYESVNGNRYLYLPMWGPPAKDLPAFKLGNGPTPNGSIMAFQLADDAGKLSLVPQWMSPNMTVPDSPVVANGVVYALQTGEQTLQNQLRPGQQLYERPPPGTPRPTISAADAAKFRATPVSNLILYAFDAETGKQLYASKKTIPDWVHFTEPVVTFGKVFVVTHDAHVYAFGLKR